MDWFALSLLAGFFFAGARVIARYALRDEGNALAFTAIHDLIAGFVLLPFILIQFHLPTNPWIWLSFLGIVITAFLADWLAFLALKYIDVSLYQVLIQMRHGLLLLGGLLFFSEEITGTKVLSVILIILGVGVAFYKKERGLRVKGVLFTLASTLAATIAFLFVKGTVVDFSETAAASFELMLIGVLSFALLRFRTAPVIAEFKRQRWGLLVSGALFGFFELFLFYALNTGEASRVIPVVQSSLIFTLIFGIVFLRERTRLVQKISGTVIITAGIIFLYVL